MTSTAPDSRQLFEAMLEASLQSADALGSPASAEAPVKRAFLRKGEGVERRVAVHRADAKPALHTPPAQAKPSEGDGGLSPMSAAKTVDRRSRAPAHANPHALSPSPSADPRAAAMASSTGARTTDRLMHEESSLAEFEALERLVHTHLDDRAARPSSADDDERARVDRVPSPQGGRTADAAMPRTATTSAEQPPSTVEDTGQWWDQLCTSLQLHLPSSPEKGPAETSRGERARGAPSEPPPSERAAGPSAAPSSSAADAPTSRLVSTLFHKPRHTAASAPRRETRCAATTAGRAHAPDSRADGGAAEAEPGAQPASAPDAALRELERTREAMARERVKLVRARERSRRHHQQLELRERQLDASAKALEDDRAHFETWRQAETARLGREQRALEKQAKTLLRLPDRRERGEAEVLREKLDEAAEQASQKERRAKLALDRLRRQLAAEAAAKAELEQELRLVSAEVAEVRAAKARGVVEAGAATRSARRAPAPAAGPAAQPRGVLADHLSSDSDDGGRTRHALATTRLVGSRDGRASAAALGDDAAGDWLPNLRSGPPRAGHHGESSDDEEEEEEEVLEASAAAAQYALAARAEHARRPAKLTGTLFHAPAPASAGPRAPGGLAPPPATVASRLGARSLLGPMVVDDVVPDGMRMMDGADGLDGAQPGGGYDPFAYAEYAGGRARGPVGGVAGERADTRGDAWADGGAGFSQPSGGLPYTQLYG